MFYFLSYMVLIWIFVLRFVLCKTIHNFKNLSEMVRSLRIIVWLPDGENWDINITTVQQSAKQHFMWFFKIGVSIFLYRPLLLTTLISPFIHDHFDWNQMCPFLSLCSVKLHWLHQVIFGLMFYMAIMLGWSMKTWVFKTKTLKKKSRFTKGRIKNF